jgi:hypothetical protein
MSSTRLAWLLVGTLAFAGAVATPVRAVESTRLVPSIVRCADDGGERTEAQAELPLRIWPVEAEAPVTVQDINPAALPCLPLLAYALYRRPPPAA